VKVRIRMYRVGLGDCFLLSFGQAAQVHVLIDCGVLLGTRDAAETVQECVEDIRQTTNGHLHVVAATHEHWDHVGGFAQAGAVFDKLEIDQIWLPWTEDPDDRLAKRLRDERNQRKAKLKAACALWRSKLGPAPDRADPSLAAARVAMTERVLAFGEPELLGVKATTADALGYLKNRKDRKEYLEPGTSRRLPGTDDVRVYVLGPPRDERLLRKGLPSKKTPETYAEHEPALTLADSFFAAVETAVQPDDRAVDTSTQPFDDFHRVPARTPQELAALGQPGTFYSEHYLAGDDWRRIDEDWLGATSDLALALDSDTNNTSLVLAFELGDGGEVLLFPGDAQVGNWLSWKDLAFEVRSGGGRRTVTTEQMLARTVLYKVGHHASHNATLREHGLEKMTHPELVAMIPVDRGAAEKQRWAMPFPPLFERLLEKCRGRVLLLDEDQPDGRRLRRLGDEGRDAFLGRVAITKLYTQLVIET